jgi:hypothetical protein
MAGTDLTVATTTSNRYGLSFSAFINSSNTQNR